MHGTHGLAGPQSQSFLLTYPSNSSHSPQSTNVPLFTSKYFSAFTKGFVENTEEKDYDMHSQNVYLKSSPVGMFSWLCSLISCGELSVAEILRSLQISEMLPWRRKYGGFPKVRKSTNPWDCPKSDPTTNTHHYYKFLLSNVLNSFHQRYRLSENRGRTLAFYLGFFIIISKSQSKFPERPMK